MITFSQQKIIAFIRLLNNALYHNKLIVLIGNKGIFLCAINRSKLIESLFVANEEPEQIAYCLRFLQKFKKYYIIFLLDDNDCMLRHEFVPVLQSIVRINPVEEFIQEHFSEQDIVAYNVYDVTDQNGENWSVAMVSTTYNPPLSHLLSYSLENSMKFGGIYFLTLECDNIINIVGQHLADVKNNIQIFVIITQTSGIKFIIKHFDDIISAKNIEYLLDKPKAYIQGIIEQEITDCLILLKRRYEAALVQNTYLIFLVDQELQKLLQQSSFNVKQVSYVSDHELTITHDNSISSNTTPYFDHVISRLFAINRRFLGLNNMIKSIMTLDLINKCFFKPVIGLIIAMVLAIATIKIKTIITVRKTQNLNYQYHKMILEYKNVSQHPELQNIANLMDLYTIDKLLKVPKTTPFDLVEQVLKSLVNTKIHLVKISWQSSSSSLLTLSTNKTVTLELLVKYIASNSSIVEALDDVNKYIADLRSKLQNCKISYTRPTDGMISLFGSVTMPVSISISGY